MPISHRKINDGSSAHTRYGISTTDTTENTQISADRPTNHRIARRRVSEIPANAAA